MKGSCLLKHLQEWPASGRGVLITSFGCSYSQVGRVRLSLYKLNTGTLIYSQAEGQDPLRQAIMYDYNNKSHEKQVKETVSNMKSEMSSLQHFVWLKEIQTFHTLD